MRRIAQADLGRQVGDGQALHCQRHRRAADGAGEDEHAVVGLDLALHRVADIHLHRQGHPGGSGRGRRRRVCRPRSCARGHAGCRPGSPSAPGPRSATPTPGAPRSRWRRRSAALRRRRCRAGQGWSLRPGRRFSASSARALICAVIFFATGEIQCLRPLAEHFRLPPAEFGGAFEGPRRIGAAFLGHVGATEEVPALGGIRLGYRALQARGHLFHGVRCLGEFAGQLDLVAGAPMQVQAERDQRHQQRRDQRDRPAGASYAPPLPSVSASSSRAASARPFSSCSAVSVPAACWPASSAIRS